ncbi:potassium channel protein [Bacillus marinisedimentorum]|uniref:potassium channel protein n=1 Tax=Bacillus marinisedimentorum TaxID=1821260 RepID=UPI000872909C|nr:potassium channel family protein [Bacillus marinisedimentorum]
MLVITKFIIKMVRLNNWVLFWSTATLLFFSSFFIAYLEPQTFPTPFEGLWWVMTTVTTVGYGDYSPVTIAGKMYAMFLYIFGIGLIGVVIGKIIDWFGVFRKLREEGKLAYTGTGHIVIIGWSRKAEFAVEEILDSSDKAEIVIIDELPTAPYLNERVHYVQGQAADKKIIEMANVSQSQAVIVFADDTIQNTQLADGKTLLIASSIEHYATNVHTTVEILNEEHIHNFQHSQVDEFVVTHETISRLAVRSAFTKGIASLYSQLMSRNHGDDLYPIEKKRHWHTYRDAFDSLLNEGATLIADRSSLDINRKLDEEIPDDAMLYIICDKETYKKIAGGQ